MKKQSYLQVDMLAFYYPTSIKSYAVENKEVEKSFKDIYKILYEIKERKKKVSEVISKVPLPCDCSP